MRSRWLGALIGVGLMLPGAPAPAAATPPAEAARSVSGFMPVGTVNYIWTGDPARGCAAEGLCGVVGSLQIMTGNTSTSSSGPGPQPIDLQDSSAVARVQQPGADGMVHTCVDLVPYDAQFILRHGPTGALRAVPDVFGAQPPLAGRCAGPTAADVQGVALPARKLGRRGYDLSGTVTFGAGPFTITVISTIRALFVSPSSFSSGGPPFPPTPKSALAEQADVAYRVISAQGELTASFSGLAQPFCAPLDACGATGTVSLGVTARRGTLDFSGSRLVNRRMGSRRALADLRAGRLRLDRSGFAVQLGGELTGTLTGASPTPCHDSGSVSSLSLVEGAAPAAYRLTVGGSGAPFGPDALRTRCPGPSFNDIVGRGTLAGGLVTLHDLGASRLTVVLSGAGRFSGSAYGGVRSGSIILTLARTHVSAGTRRVRIYGRQVIG